MKASLISGYSLFLLLIMLSLHGCRNEQDIIMTVTGPIDPQELGITLPHEHFLVDFIGADSTGYHRWNKDTVIAIVLPYLIEAKQFGVNSIVECTPAFLGRDPVLLQRLSVLSGINILTNTGYYGAINNKALPSGVFTESADEIAAAWIHEWQNGIDSSHIRPGFIKIAVPADSILSPVHEKLVRAAARAHLSTGLTINGHTGPARPAIAEIEILKEEGVDPSAFIWTHAQAGTDSTRINLAKEGAWISLDNIMDNNIEKYVKMLLILKQNNLLNRILLSHDAGWYDVIDPKGITYRNHTAIFTHLRPALLKIGFTREEWTMLVSSNPIEAYTVRIRKVKFQ